MKNLLLIIASLFFTTAAHANIYVRSLTAPTLKYEDYAKSCTEVVIPWMFELKKNGHLNFTLKDSGKKEPHVFSEDFDQKFQALQNERLEETKTLNKSDRSLHADNTRIRLTNLLIQGQPKFMRECMKLYKVSTQRCSGRVLSPGEGRGEFIENCSSELLNATNFHKIRVRQRI